MHIFQQHPPHIRKKIALVITGVLAFILILIMVFFYLKPESSPGNKEAGSKLGNFYETILENGQAYFSR